MQAGRPEMNTDVCDRLVVGESSSSFADDDLGCSLMEWARPLYRGERVKRAGKVLVAPGASAEDYEIATAVVDNWRSAHAFPLNTLQMAVRRAAKAVDPSVKPVQRLKRLPSIRAKLQREPAMALN